MCHQSSKDILTSVFLIVICIICIDNSLPNAATRNDTSHQVLRACQARGYAFFLHYPDSNSLQPYNVCVIIGTKIDYCLVSFILFILLPSHFASH